MSTKHKWHVVTPTANPHGTKVYLDDEEFELPLREIHISIIAGEPVTITTVAFPHRGLDALLTFSEENPLAVDITWPLCPHCGKLYNEEKSANSS